MSRRILDPQPDAARADPTQPLKPEIQLRSSISVFPSTSLGEYRDRGLTFGGPSKMRSWRRVFLPRM